MQNHSLARSVVAHRDELVRKAIDFALKRDDWTPEQVKARGICEYHKYSDGTEVFAVNGVDMIEFHPEHWWSEKVDHVEKLVASQHYRVLCPELEKYLEA